MRRFSAQHVADRNDLGNITILASISVFVLLAFLVIATSIGSAWTVNTLMSRAVDDMALSAAQTLNRNNRIGKMNELLVRARQLEVASTELAAQVSEIDPDLAQLASKIADLDQKNVTGVASKLYDNLRLSCEKDVQESLEHDRKELMARLSVRLPWLIVEPLEEKSQPEYGYLMVASLKEQGSKTVSLCNVNNSLDKEIGLDGLAKQDEKHVVRNTPFLAGNVDLKLESVPQLAHQHFKIAAIPPTLPGRTPSPARNANLELFKSDNEYLPTAISIRFSAKLHTIFIAQTTNVLTAVGVAESVAAAAHDFPGSDEEI